MHYTEHLNADVTKFEACFPFAVFVVLDNLPNPLNLSSLRGKQWKSLFPP